VDFYRIVKRTGDFVTLEPLLSEHVNMGSLTGKVVATDIPKDWKGDHDIAWGNKNLEKPKPLFRRKLHREGGRVTGLTVKFGYAKLWDGQPKYVSFYR